MDEFALEYDFVGYPGYFERPENARAALCAIHGVGEHFGRYGRFAGYLASRGIAVYGIDLPGHGRSPGIRGHIGPRDELYALLDRLLAGAAEQCPGAPLFLMGHSMGGNIALSYRLARPDAALRGCVISSPWLRLVTPPSRLMRGLLPFIAALRPTATMKNGIKGPLFTPAEGAPPEPDPLMHGLITPRTAHDCFGAAREILRRAGEAGPPVYLFHGDRDGVCSVEGSREFAGAAGSACTYREWPGLGHETLNEAAWEDVAGAACDWILERAGRGG